MSDLDSLLQDFSYLKSLEHKNEAPKRVHRKLMLPDPSVKFSIEYLFRKTGEATFDRIFNRPIGRRMFEQFVFQEEFSRRQPAARLLLDFVIEVKELAAEQPKKAYAEALAMKAKYIEKPVLVSLRIWDLALREAMEAKLRKLEAKARRQDEDPSRAVHSANIKEFFVPFIPDARKYLADEPWKMFLQSPQWVRYCQWKHLELNMTVSKNDFDVHRILGRGGFGEVFGCRKLDTGAMFAMKMLDKKRLKLKHQEMSAVHERNVLAEMHSRFVTNLKYAFHDSQFLYLILDLMEGGDLSFHLKKMNKFTEDQARFYGAEIVMGLAHIHSRNMIYRDLKPANILLDGRGHARISDMGLVRDMSRSLPTSECGTHGYMAPEVLKADVTYDEGADWWSLGCVIYQFLAGYTPFRGNEKKKTSKEEIDRRTLEMPIEYPSYFSPEVKDLLSKLLDRNPKTRLGCCGRGASEIRAHPWFDNIDWQALVDHKLAPPIRPLQGQVNARGVYDIDRFDTYDTRRVVVDKADNDKYYRNFNHIMTHQWQEEVLESVFNQVTDLSNRTEQAKQRAIAAKATEPVVTDAIMQGYMTKRGGLFHSAWVPRYYYLFPDRIEWVPDQQQRVIPKRRLPLIEIASITERQIKDDDFCIVAQHTDGREYIFRAMHNSDHECWMELLEAAWIKVREPSKSSTFARSHPKRHSFLGDNLTSGDVPVDSETSKTKAVRPAPVGGEGEDGESSAKTDHSDGEEE
eukprot:m.162949 g.162949  ORF g.162949 m.162949 type:complete len:743 (-) comp17102_c0_seq1:2139-4367(-)